MNRKELIDNIADKTGLKKVDCNKVLDAFIETTVETLQKSDTVVLVGFGTFKVVDKKAREGRNPATGETIQIAAKKAPKFIPGKSFKESIDK